ncbi:hypothetical protein [Streptomyces niveus]|uniref:hypothetical protein n=1 Tax=Streptomyces niveus TaxID=193462 RepID=UPI0034252661
MDWTKMTARQRDAARVMLERLRKEGVSDVSVSQVAKYFEEAMAWNRGEISLGSLCAQTGWDLPATAAPEPGEPLAEAVRDLLAASSLPTLGSVDRVAHIAADVAALKTALARLKPDLLDAITAADRSPEPQSRETLVRAASPGLSRRLVVQHLGSQDVLTLAQDAVKESGIAKDRHYSVQLAPTADGAVTLRFDSDYPEEHVQAPDEYDYQEGSDVERRNPDPHYVAEHNALAFLLDKLREKGLTCATDGPHETVIDDLRDMEPGIVRANR